jgi:hypothetical protein
MFGHLLLIQAAVPPGTEARRGDDGRTAGRSRLARISAALRVAAFFTLLAGGTARAGDPWEFWPELNLFKRLGPTTRAYFVAAYAEGKESEFRTLDLAGYFDLTFKPFTRDLIGKEHWRRQDDWRQKRYVWLRLGYDHVFKQEGEEASTPG